MPESQILDLARSIAVVLEIAGIGVIVLGAVLATAKFVRALPGSREFNDVYHGYRANFGRAILLGLEFLVAGDIIRTVALEPTFANLGVLAGIVLIRTFLSFSLEVEINGRWPWQVHTVEKEGGTSEERL